MDPMRRSASRLRRLQVALASSAQAHVVPEHGPVSVRALRPSGAGLRQTIDDFVVAFVPPSLPITDANLTCEKALLEVRRAGGWILNAHLKALTTEPTAFILGFDTWRGYFGVTWGALNYPGDSTRVSSPTNILTVATAGTSRWIPANWSPAVQEGIEFRLVSTTDINRNFSSFFREWRNAFSDDLSFYRPLDILDDDHPNEYPAGHFGGPALGYTLDQPGDNQPGDDSGLSFEVSLRFE
jgi:hypothetical protein